MAKISYNGLGEKTYTFPANGGSAKKGDVVCLASGSARAANAGESFNGVCVSIRDVIPFQMSVQMSGFARVAYSGTAPSCGYVNLVGDGSGGVKVGETAEKKTLVVNVDTLNHTVTIYLN